LIASCGLRSRHLHSGSKSASTGKPPPPIAAPVPEAQPVETIAPVQPAVEARDVFGDVLPPGALARLGTTRFRATAFAHALAASPDGKSFAAGHLDGVLRIFDAENGTLLASWPAHEDGVTELVWGAEAIYSGGRDGKLIAWDQRGTKIKETQACDGEMSALAIDAASTRVAVGCPAKEELRIVALPELARGEVMLGHGDRVDAISFSTDGKTIAAGGYAGVIVVHGAAKASIKRGAPILSLAISPDGRSIAAGGEDAQIAIYELASKKQTAKFRAHPGGVTSLIYGTALYSAGADGRIKKFEPRSGKVLWDSGGTKSQEISSIARLKNGIVAGGAGATFHIYDEATGKNARLLEAHHDRVSSVVFSPDGDRVVTAGADGYVRVWEAANGKPIFAVRAGDVAIKAAAFVPADREIIAVDARGGRHRIDAASGKLKESKRAENEEDRLYVAISPDGKTIVEVTLSQKVLGREAKVLGIAFNEEARAMVIERESDAVIGGASPPAARAGAPTRPGLRATELASGAAVFELADEVAQAATLSGDARALFTCRKDKTAQLAAFDLEGGKAKNKRAVVFPAFECGRLWPAKNDGALAVTVAYNHIRPRVGVGEGRWQLVAAPKPIEVATKIFDPKNLQDAFALIGHDGGVEAAAFSPDGERIATAGFDTTVLIWSLRSVRGK
jgi:WD40 repeat protein